MSEPLRVAALISGAGSNLKALMDAAAEPGAGYRVVLALSNRPDAPGLERARAAGVPTQLVDHRRYDSREDFERQLLRTLASSAPDIVALAGFMRVLTATFVTRYPDRLLNIHPSRLPRYPGLDTHQRALADGAREHGATVHFVRCELDSGPIAAQSLVPVLPDDDEARLAARVLDTEHAIYPETLRCIAAGRMRLDGDVVRLDGQPVTPAHPLRRVAHPDWPHAR